MAHDLTEADRAEKSGASHRALLALILPLCLVLSACVSAGPSAISALNIDKTTTSSITPLSADSEMMSDEKLISELAGGLDETNLATPTPWSNPQTGSAGVISQVSVLRDGDKTCRLFETTRHAFDGVALYSGRICRRPDGGWDLVGFERAGG